MRHRRSLCSAAGIVAAILVTPVAVSAQSGHNLERPEHWKVRYDGSDEAAERNFVVMRPGWHVYAGPGSLLWDPGRFASGNYAVKSTIYLFPKGDPERSGSTRVDTPFGLFLGGRDLEGDKPTYVSFLIDNTGRFHIARHTGDDIEEFVPWTTHDALTVLDDPATSPAENVLEVDIRGEQTFFHIGGEVVAQLPSDELDLNGLIGLSAGDGLSLHITEIEIGPNRRNE
ncbi:MAG: hypothetical protein F4060_08350 [Holophagales bacterium]|nr:hypothetical protein [Holophagales bacterium]MYG29544.1 hypothetical protein [Holophagales bacterium]MYI79938.1 hypothetical protein [Holophagales bacterium]